MENNNNEYQEGRGLSTKTNSRCLSKAGEDEPIFVLRAKDPTAPDTIRQWVVANQNYQPAIKLKTALDLALEMEDWYRENVGE